MNDFKSNSRFGNKRPSGGFGKKQFDRPSFGDKPAFQRSAGKFGRPSVQMYPATCATCGKATEVPFRPDGSRPLYCRDCLGGNKSFAPTSPAPARDFSRPTFRTPMPMPRALAPAQPAMPDPRIVDMQQNIAKMQQKLDQILVALAVSKALATVEATPAVKVAKKKVTKKK